LLSYYKGFLSSVGECLTNERVIVREYLWKHSFIPIAMEGFVASNNTKSIDTIKKNLDNSDVLILLVGPLYGSLVNNMNKTNCGLNKCSLCNGEKCVISYTQFEYMYAKENKKLIYCLLHDKYDDCRFWIDKENMKGDESNHFMEEFQKDRGSKAGFVSIINEGQRLSFSDERGLEEGLSRMLQDIRDNLHSEGNMGLVSGDYIEKNKELSEEIKLYKSLNCSKYLLENKYDEIFLRLKKEYDNNASNMSQADYLLLSLMYEVGIGTSQDSDQANNILEEAKKLGNIDKYLAMN